MRTRIFRVIGVLILSAGMLAMLLTPMAGQEAMRVVATVPLLYDPPRVPVPLIRLSINGRPPALFVLSSAAPFALMISPEKAPELGLAAKTGLVPLQSVHLVDERGNTANELDIPAAYIAETNLNQIDIGLGVTGIVGSNFFAGLPVELNFREKKLRFLNNSIDEIIDSEKNKYVAIKLARPDRRAWVHTVQVSLPGNQPVEMQVATGSWRSSLAEKDMRLVEIAEIAPTPFHFGRLSRGREAAFSTFLGRFDWLMIGGIKVKNVPCLLKLNFEENASRLGVDILALFEQVILDYRSGYLLLKKPQETLVAFTDGISGLAIELDNEQRLRVVKIDPQSAGERAGFRPGDIIVEINGHSVKGVTPAIAQVLINGYAGVRQQVKILRDGTSKELSLIPDSPFVGGIAPQPLNPEGKVAFGFSTVLVEMGWTSESMERFLLVTRISSDAVRQAGLRVGDKIVAINGRSDWDENWLRKLLQQEEKLHLTVKRPGERESHEIRIKRPSSDVVPVSRQ